MSCAVCGTALVPGAHFCFNCGAPQDATVMEEPERRRVTVLFGDLSDFTAWAEDLDPERVGVVTDRVLAALARIVTDVGGHVDKLTGDGIMAVFGAPTAHEDDPERAVRAAELMQRTVGRLVADEVGGGQRLGLRVGLNTGEVLAGVQGQLSYTVVGDTVNTASRLSDAAGVGAVYAGRETAMATMHTASWRALSPLRLKGKREPVEAYELLRLRTGVNARLGIGDEAPLIGRIAELGALIGKFEKVVETGVPSSVLVLGDAGVGKSRLVHEFVRITTQTPGTRVLWGRCSPYGLGRDLQPLAEIVRTGIGADITDDVDAVTARLGQALGRLETLDPGARASVVERLLSVLGIGESSLDAAGVLGGGTATPGGRAEQPELDAIAALLNGFAAEAPLVVIVEDTHHAQRATTAALRGLGQRLRGSLLSLGVGRAEGMGDDSFDVLSAMPDPLLIALEPLDEGACEQLLKAYLGGAELAAPVRRELVDRSQGNPFFLAELLQLLIDRGVLQAGSDGSWELVGELPRDVPAGVQAVLAARIDSLEPAARALLRDAAVIGTSFPAEVLPALDPRLDPEMVEPILASMADRGILTTDGSGRWTFTHTLARDVAYAGLPKADRARQHAAVALWALEYSPEPPAAVDAIVAVQADRAVRLAQEMRLPRNDPAWAAAAAGLAAATRLGRLALRRDDDASAQAHLIRAQRLALLIGADDAARLPVELSYAAAMARMRRLDEASAHLVDGLRSDLPEMRAGALVIQGDVLFKRGEYADARTALVQAFVLAGEYGLDEITSAAIRQLGLLDFFEGHLAAAEERFRESLELARRVGDPRSAGWSLQNLAWSATMRGDYPLAADALRDARAVFTELQDAGGLAWCAGTEALVSLLQGQLGQARSLVRGLLPLTSGPDASWEAGICRTIDALAAVDLGELDDAADELAEAVALFERLGDTWGLAFSGIGQGQLARARGETAEAAKALRRAAEIAAAEGHTPLVLLADVSLGLLYLDRGDVRAAAACAERAEALLTHVDILTGAMIGLWVVRLRVDRALGQPDRAATLLRTSLEGNVPNYLFPRRQAYAHLAAAQLEQGHEDEAYATICRALDEPAEDVRSHIVAKRVQAEILRRRGDFAAARTAATEALALVESTGYVGELAPTEKLLARLPS